MSTKQIRTAWLLLLGGASVALISGCSQSKAAAADGAAPTVATNAEAPTTDTPTAGQPTTSSSVDFDSGSFVETAAPDFKLPQLSGGQAVQLSKLKGKVVLIDFWAPWCPPCKAGLPFTERMHKELESKGLVVLTIATDPAKTVQAFVNKNHYSFPVLMDPKFVASMKYDVQGIPCTVIIDKTGKMVGREVGLHPQAETIDTLTSAGVDTTGFVPENDPTNS